MDHDKSRDAARLKCRLTGGTLTTVLDLGTPCVSDFVCPGEIGTPSPLYLAVGDTWPHLVQLTHSVAPESMYRRYHYRSGTNEAMVRELDEVVQGALRRRPISPQDIWLDIACNDGTLLRQVIEQCHVNTPKLIGIDPSDVAREAANSAPYTLINDFFSPDAYHQTTHEPAAVVTCVAMFYDLEDPVGFLHQVRSVLREDGLLILQVHFAGMMRDTNAFDAICHEHLTYWGAEQLQYALDQAALKIIDAEITSSNGGSIRVYAMPELAANRYARTIEGLAGAERWLSLLVRERAKIGDPLRQWQDFGHRVERLREETREFLEEARSAGEWVLGYGASTKGNTLLQYFGITSDLLPAIADRQSHKRGLVTAGSNIPIISEEEMRALRPDYLFVLPWHFADVFRVRERDLLTSGCRMVTVLPEFTVHEI